MTDKEKPRHDALFKQVMSEPIAAREFLEYYLPDSFKDKIDLSNIKIEKESFVTEDLRKQLSDIVYSLKLKGSERKAYAYVLIEHQSSSDYWISFRLWQYMLLLCERHRKGQEKLPLICPIVVYANDKAYNAPRSFWELFTDQQEARALMGGEYLLVDLQKQSDEEIERKAHLGMMEYMLKHIKARDMLALWDGFLTKFKPSIELDKKSGYIYLKWFLWYTDAKVAEDKQQKLDNIINKHLTSEERKNIMRTIADKYIDEGIEKGIVQGIEVGKQQGIQIGEARGKYEVARNMLSNNYSIPEVSRITGLSIQELNELHRSKS